LFPARRAHGNECGDSVFARAADLLHPLAPEMDVAAPVSSLGMASRQVVEIARTLARGGRIIAFDEPTSSLTPTERDRLFAIIRDLKAHGRGIVYISHRMPEIYEIADRITVLRDGRVVAEGPPNRFPPDELNSLIAGRKLAEAQGRHPSAVTPPDEEALRLERVTNVRLRGIDLVVHRGEILGLAGLVGSGRSALARRPDRGDAGWPPVRDLRQHDRSDRGKADAACWRDGGCDMSGETGASAVTLGTLSIYRAAALIYTNGQPIYTVSHAFRAFLAGSLGGIPAPVLLALAVAVMVSLLLRFTTLGEHIIAVGGSGFELPAIGSVIGALTLSAMQNGLTLRNVASFWQYVATGAVVILAVFADQVTRRRT
jgi:energy-coupling factor transporter ATP-binding protein EcfA2